MNNFKKHQFVKVCAWVLSVLLCSPYAYAQNVGTITYVEGRVEVLNPNDDTARPLRKDEPVAIGDIIRTKTNAKAELTFDDNSKLQLAHSTKIQINDYQLDEDNKRIEATILLDRGKVRALVDKRRKKGDFNIHTPNSHGTIKGSDVFAFYQAGSTGMLVASGKLSVVNPITPEIPPVMVTPGQSILVPQGGPIKGPRTFLELEKEFHERDTSPPVSAAKEKDLNVIEGTVAKVSGEVMITPKGEKKAHALNVNEIVREGDTIETGDDGMLELKFDNGNSLSLKSNTHLVIEKLVVDPKTEEYENTFKVDVGKVKAVVEDLKGNSSFKVKTPQATSGVRGTIMYLVVTSIITQSFFEGGPGFIESLISGAIQDVGMGETASADNLGNVTDPTPVTDAERSNFSEGFVPGGDTEGYSSPEGYLYEGDTGVDVGGGTADTETSQDNSINIPITETLTSLLLQNIDTILAALPGFFFVNKTITPRLRISDFDDGTTQGWATVFPFGGILSVDNAGGHPDGFLFTQDNEAGGNLLIQLPVALLSALDNSSGLLFDEFIYDNGPSTVRKVSVILQGIDGTRFQSEQDLDKVLNAWTNRFVDFQDASQWTRVAGSSSFEDVLANLDSLFLSTDTSNLDNENREVGIDNIAFLLNNDTDITFLTLVGDIVRTGPQGGTYALLANGTYQQELPEGWQLLGLSGNTTGEGDFVGGTWLAGANGGAINDDGSFDAVFNAIWVELHKDGTLSANEMGGELLGNYIEVGESGGTWNAASSGQWVEVDSLINLDGVNDDLVALSTPIVPITEVYTSLLAGGGVFNAGGAINFDNILLDFFASDVLALNGLWASNLNGTFNGPTSDGFNANVNGNLIDSSSNNVIGTVNATLTGTEWNDGNWQAILEGSTDTGLSLAGQTAGTYSNGSGTFSGGGVGTWEQGP